MYPFATSFVELVAGLLAVCVLVLAGLILGDWLAARRLGNPFRNNNLQLDIEALIADLTSFA
jgi:hypothetical protein